MKNPTFGRGVIHVDSFAHNQQEVFLIRSVKQLKFQMRNAKLFTRSIILAQPLKYGKDVPSLYQQLGDPDIAVVVSVCAAK